MLPTGFRTFHFVSFLYVFFFSFLFLLFRFFSHYFVFVFLRFVFFRFFSLLFSLFSFRFFSFRFFSFLFVFFRFSVYRYPRLRQVPVWIQTRWVTSYCMSRLQNYEIKRLDVEKYVPVIIGRTISLVDGLSTSLYRLWSSSPHTMFGTS